MLSLSYGNIVRKDMSSNDGLLPESFETYQIVRPSDVVFRLTDLQNDKRSLRSALVGEQGIITSAYLAVTPVFHDSRYFAFLMRAYDAQKVFYSMGGGLRQSMKFDDMKHLPVMAPTLDEQRQIAGYLDTHTAKIDTLIGKQEQLIETLAERRQAVISHAVTKGLDPNVSMKDSGVEWLSAIPDTWTVPRVAHHFSIVLGKMVNAGKVNEPGLFDAPYLRAGNVQPYGVDTTEAKTMPMSAAELTQLSLRIGDLVVVEGGQGGYGRSALVLADLSGWGYQNHVMRVRPKSYESNAFLDYVIKALRAAGYIASLSSHASLPSFSAEKLAAIRYGRPPVSEQGAIVEYLDHETTKIDVLAAKAREMIDVLKERRQALISAAVTGKIDVRGLV